MHVRLGLLAVVLVGCVGPATGVPAHTKDIRDALWVTAVAEEAMPDDLPVAFPLRGALHDWAVPPGSFSRGALCFDQAEELSVLAPMFDESGTATVMAADGLWTLSLTTVHKETGNWDESGCRIG